MLLQQCLPEEHSISASHQNLQGRNLLAVCYQVLWILRCGAGGGNKASSDLRIEICRLIVQSYGEPAPQWSWDSCELPCSGIGGAFERPEQMLVSHVLCQKNLGELAVVGCSFHSILIPVDLEFGFGGFWYL